MRANCFLENVKHSTLLPLGSALEMLQESLLAPQVTLVLFSHVMAEHNVKFDKGTFFSSGYLCLFSDCCWNVCACCPKVLVSKN